MMRIPKDFYIKCDKYNHISLVDQIIWTMKPQCMTDQWVKKSNILSMVKYAARSVVHG